MTTMRRTTTYRCLHNMPCACQDGCCLADPRNRCSAPEHDHGVHRSVGISQGSPRNLPIFDLMTGIAKASAPADDPGILIAGLKNP